MKKNIKNSSHSFRIWNRNFKVLTIATICGSAGAIAAGYALSFLVFYETESVFLSALVLIGRLLPAFVLPLFAGVLLDRFSRCRILVTSDALNGILYLILGIWLWIGEFSYTAYLLYSLLLGCASCLDELAYDAVAPMTMTPGGEQKSYAISAMIYPTLNVIMMPAAGLIMNTVGIPVLLLTQGFLSLLAALLDAQIHVVQKKSEKKGHSGFEQWKADIVEAYGYLKNEPGLMSMFVYSAMSNALAQAFSPSLIAFFSITPGFNALMYSFFSVAECLGRMAGSMKQYLVQLPAKRCYSFSIFALATYNLMDGLLLFCPYPLMLANRFLVGGLGATTYSIRAAAIQTCIPDQLRGRINSFQSILIYLMTGIMVFIFGLLGDLLSPSWLMVVSGLVGMVCLYLTWGTHRSSCQKVFLNGNPLC